MPRLLPLLVLCSLQQQVGTAAASRSTAAAADDFSVNVDYGAFLERSDPVWEWDGTEDKPPPFGWWSMGFTGNGLLVRPPPQSRHCVPQSEDCHQDL